MVKYKHIDYMELYLGMFPQPNYKLNEIKEIVMEKYYWDILVKSIGLNPYQAEVVLDIFTTELDYNIETIGEAEANLKELVDLEFLFDKSLGFDEKSNIINKLDMEN